MNPVEIGGRAKLLRIQQLRPRIIVFRLLVNLIPKLDVAGSTPVARSREFEDLARCRQEPGAGGGSFVTLCS